jgi:hypothetical protein
VILNVVPEQDHPYRFRPDEEAEGSGPPRPGRSWGSWSVWARPTACACPGRVEPGQDPETVILDLAETGGVDLIILGTDARAGSERLFLGPRVERLLSEAPCPVLIVNGS